MKEDPEGELMARRLRLIAEHSRDLVLLLDLDGKILYASPSNRTLLGLDPDSLIGCRVHDFIHPDDRALQSSVFRERIDTRSPARTELRICKADGTFIHVESLGVPILDDTGFPEAVVVTGRDISERKLAEKALSDGEHRLRMILEQTPALLWTTDRELRFVSGVGRGLAQLGLKMDELNGVRLSQFFGTDDPAFPAIAAHVRALKGESVTYDTEWAGRFFQSVVEPLLDAGQNITGVIGFATDVTDRRLVERRLEQSERRYRALFDRNLAGVYRSTLDGVLLECNLAMARTLGYDSIEEILAVPTWNHYFTRGDREGVIAALKEKGQLQQFELRLRRKDGTEVWVLQNEGLVFDEVDNEARMEGTIIDITARKTAEERFEHQAYHDHLTDLPNRLMFNDRLTLAMAQAHRVGEHFAVMFLDLDHFKLINDTMAHSAGDELLQEVARRLKAIVRSEDTVARMGGDEFTLLFPHLEQEKDAARIARIVLDSLTSPFVIHEREVYVTASIGISMFPADGTDPDTLVKNADSAMYRAKDLGRNNIQFYTPVAQLRAEARLGIETALRHAVERGEFYLDYQPLVSLSTGAIVGVEALIRWLHPERGMIPPNDFIPIAEEIGLILPIGEWVLRTAGNQINEWKRRGLPPLRMGVNLSPRQFESPSLLLLISRLIADKTLDPHLLDLEITESLAMRDTSRTVEILRQLRSLGATVSIDDFGTGYSSLSYLKTLPINRLKIDQLFIREIVSDGMDETIVDAIIKMAHSMGLQVIAEGVETDDQREVLRLLGCDEMQGFVFSRPTTPANIEELVRAHQGI